MSHPVDIAAVRSAVALASRAPSAFNTQPWSCRLDADTAELHVYADPIRLLPITEADTRDLVLSCGSMLHHLTVALADAGIETTTRRIPDPSQVDLMATIELRPGVAPVASSGTAAATIRRRQSDPRPFGDEPVAEWQLNELMASAREYGMTLRTVPAEHRSRLGAAAPAASGPAVDADPAALTWTGVRDYTPRGEDADVDADHATYLVLGAGSTDRFSLLEAGEALSAVLLRATALGLSSCPLTGPLDDEAARDSLAADVFDDDASPVLLVRVGQAMWPRQPMSTRRPIEDFLRIGTTARAMMALAS